VKFRLLSIFFITFCISYAQNTGKIEWGSEVNDNILNIEQLPVNFDLRESGRLSPIKTQPDGGCWTSATMASVESLFRTFGYGKFELSDINLKLCHCFDPERSSNGNHFMATAYFSRGAGPLPKAPETDSLCDLTPQTTAYITDARFLPDNPSLIKKVIMNFGAVYSMMYFNKNELDTVSNVYYAKSRKINHVIDIIGWNDTINTITGKGVWIAQNSLGIKFGDSGFFYIPYDDPNILQYNAIWNKWIAYDSLLQIYYYDTLGSYRSYGYNDSLIYGLIKFTAGSDCEIIKIGTSVNHPDTRIYTEIYTGFNKKTGKLTGKSAIISEKNCKYPGYYSFDLENPVSLTKGEDFYILMRYIVPGVSMPMPVEQYVEGYGNPELTSKKCWINHNIEQWPDAWYETGAESEFEFLKFNLCIKAYCVDSGD